jgi:deazaflavin-dependent oxidoreductase (nitroreductase family)
VDPYARRGRLHRAYVRLASGRLVTWLARTRIWGAVVWRVDRHLLRLSKGRLGTGLALPTALLQTYGARTGLVRRNAVIYFHDGERVTIVASKAGHPGNPAWLYNVLANPDDVLLAGWPFRAQVVEDEAEKARLWEMADRVFPAFAAYRDRAALARRTIPIVQLVPRDSDQRGAEG